MRFIDLFIDPLYRSSTLGAMVMCLITSMLGVIVLVRRQSLIGEVLSHASYPGIALAAILFFPFVANSAFSSYLVIILCAFACCILGYFFISFLQKKAKLYPDTALCLTLSTFLGMGILFSSALQSSHPFWVAKIQMFLYGQVATITKMHLYLYVLFGSVALVMLLGFFPRWKIWLFDKSFALMLGMTPSIHELLIATLVVFSIVLGIRMAGVILISGMLIAPPLAARQFTNRLAYMFLISGAIGMISAVLGCYLSLMLPHMIYSHKMVSIPTGPSIIIFVSLLCLFSIVFAPKKGQLFRLLRRCKFQYRCANENLLKYFWKQKNHFLTFKELQHWEISPAIRHILVLSFLRQNLITKTNGGFVLTEKGFEKANKIIRLHRLWEVYLFKYLGYNNARVHYLAEEMEHILTPTLEKKLTTLLNDPKKDPHNQPIPGRQ